MNLLEKVTKNPTSTGLYGRSWLLVYKLKLSKAYISRLNIFRDMKRLEVAKEEETEHIPYFHTYVWVVYEKKLQTIKKGYFDIFKVRPIIKLAKKDPDSILTILNLFARDPSNSHLLEEIKPKAAIGQVIRTEIQVEDHPSVPVFNRKQFSWTMALTAELWEEPDPRKIIWYFDKTGCTGKTTIAVALAGCNHRDCILLESLPSILEVSLAIKRAFKSDWNGRILLVELSGFRVNDAFYRVLDSLRDGTIGYYSKAIRWSPGFIVIFARFNPDTEKFPLMKWDIRELSKRIIWPYDEWLETHLEECMST